MRARIAVLQTAPRFGRVSENLRRGAALAAPARADLFVHPELAFTGYNFDAKSQAARLAEPAGRGPTFDAMAGLARRKNAHVAYGLAEKAPGGLYNSAVLVGPRGLVGVYRKVHLFGREKLFFKPGNRGFNVWKLPFGRVGMMVCFDWFFPEALRTLALKGAELIIHPSNLVLPHGPDAMVTRCLENRVFAATANRVGTEEGGEQALTYIGQSQIVTPKGRILTRLGRREGVGTARVDLKEARDKSINRFNDLFRDRRPAVYKKN